ncbi:mechanosensitive ion channel family protein [Pelagibacteraceae bacterium]|nr:mechanosensitive ion channel family protein [Pelagibacteraceae bacterium]
MVNFSYDIVIQKEFLLINQSISNFIDKILLITLYFIPSIFIMMFYKYEVLSLNDKSGTTIPEIITFIFQFLLFAIPSFLVLSFVFNLELTSILAAGGIVFAAIALSLQSSLSDLIKGIFVNIERPFAINDWITVDDKTGYVENITWRSTRIRTFQNTEVIIPNEIVADSILTNWSKQDKEKMSEGFHIFNKLYFHPSHDPENISKLLYNALKKAKPVDGREQLNLQWVRFIGANEFGLEFVVAFDCTKRILKNSMQDSVMMEIHKTLRHAGVQMSAGKLYGKLEEDTGLHALDTNRNREDFEKRQVSEFNPYNESVKNRVLLQKIPIFMSLNSEDLDEIAENAERLHFEKDDYIIKQNDSGDSLYVINDGVVSVYLDNESKDKVFLAKLGVGDFVGEGSLLTGEPRSANVIAETPCIVIKVSKDIIKDIFSKNPNVYDYVANILAHRKLKLDKKKNESQLTKDENKNLVNDIKNAIINFLK